jgi:heavy metal sensor kinase
MKRFAGFRAFFHSIRFRLVLWFTVILALVLFAFSAFVYYNQVRDIRGEALYRLEHKLNEIEMALETKTPVTLQEADVFVLLNDDGLVLASQGIASDQDVLDLVSSAQQAQQQSPDRHPEPSLSWIGDRKTTSQRYIYALIPVSLPAQTGYAILGSLYDPYELSRRLLFTLLLGSLLTIAIALGGGLWLADRAMRPVQTITQAARSIGETDLSRRLNLKGRDELSELANTFDDMLARLQAAFERQRQFVADASHELRTPLTIVNLESTRALASKRTPAEYQRALGVIHSENEFMAHLVNDLLTLARMDSGQMAMEKTPLDLSDLALEAVERLASLADRKNVRLETGDLPEVTLHGDRRYLLQMLSNLVENGIKYTGGVERRVRVETGLDGETAWVRVSDTGTGIPPEHLPRLFDRFYRVDQARARGEGEEEAQGGSGLGLSIVNWIVRAHDGEVRVASAPGAGTTFEVRLKRYTIPS